MTAPYPPAIADLLQRKRAQGCTALLCLWEQPDGWLLAPAPAGTEGVQPQACDTKRVALQCAVYLCSRWRSAVGQGVPQ